MTLLLRGLLWFGVYLVLVLLPAGLALIVDPYMTARRTAVELGAGLAFIAFPLMLFDANCGSCHSAADLRRDIGAADEAGRRRLERS